MYFFGITHTVTFQFLLHFWITVTFNIIFNISPTLIEQNILKDSNYCFNSFYRLGYSIRTLNTLSQVTGFPNYRVSIYVMEFLGLSKSLSVSPKNWPECRKPERRNMYKIFFTNLYIKVNVCMLTLISGLLTLRA